MEPISAREHQYECNPDERPSEAVVAAVSEATDRPAVTPQFGGDGSQMDPLPPLYQYVDPDALDALVSAQNGRDSGCSVTFTYGEYTVTVEERLVTVTHSE